MTGKSTQKLTIKGIEKLFNRQTVVILNAVDEKLLRQQKAVDERLLGQQKYIDYRISLLEKRLKKMEIGINQKFDRLTATLGVILD